ncbi:MAG: hypothetical protein H7Z40_11815 [Phycisphaerae bacterium]|nr:hypothetical protein [Gemmatimonadaceae bacterium]
MSPHANHSLRRHAQRARAAFARSGATASLLAMLLIAACSGGDKGPTEPVAPPVVPPPGNDPVVPLTGIVSVVPAGLPAGVSSRVLVKSGTTEHLLVGASSVAGLAAGEWTATAQQVTADGVIFIPSPATQTVTVSAAATAVVNVTYIPNTGSIDVVISGLPAGGAGDVTVSGPDGYRRLLTANTTVSALVPGRYSLDARGVKLASGSFAPASAQQNVDIVASNTPVSVSIAYVLAPSIVEVAVTGLPGGSVAAITLTPPSGSPIAVTTSTRLAAALSGRWQMNASSVKSSGFTWTPSPLSKDTSVASGDSLKFTVNYAVSTGGMALLVSGLPAGVNGAVRVTGPGSFARTVTATSTLTDLTPGVYTVSADSVQNSGMTYRTTAVTQQITVSASLVAAPAVITYSSAVATLTVGVSGVPVGATNMIEVTGPGGFDRFISGTTTFANVPPGVYTVTSSSVVLPGGLRYEASPPVVSRTLAFGVTDSVSVSYARAGGRAVITVSGLPAGANAAVSLTGNGVTTPIMSTATLDNLQPGNYTLTASSVTVASTVYTPSPVSSALVITTGGTANGSVVYTAGSVPPTPPVGTGGLNLVLDGFYLTQAIQKMDGSVPLVAGRDALLRVFVRASEANTVQPAVRVRIYDGSTLLQTLTLNAPEGTVRTALAEGTLNSTWNSLIPGASVRTAMRIVADVDPTNAITEGDETDNSWPRNGTPHAMTVSTVPAFTVRFVPVTVGSLTGNVTTGNMEQFLVSTRRMFPVNEVQADVRAPFTSSASVLQAGDGNNAWITVLNEMNALRTADGAPSTMHYYGVVKVGYSSGVAGYGYVPGRAAMGWDYLPSGDGVAVHEWGHNFGRPHTNCGNPASPDLSYPYAAGTIGNYGWNPSNGALVMPNATDVMGYCNNQWTSDWTWTRVMNARAVSGSTAAASVFGAKQEGLLVWGRIVNGKVLLEPAFRISSRPSPTATSGTHRLQALDANGNSLADVFITADKVDHVLDHDERHFAVVLPWSAKLEDALATLRVTDTRQPLAVATISSASVLSFAARGATKGQPVDMPTTNSIIRPNGKARSQISWNKGAYPMALARDAATGEILGFVRNPGDEIVSQGRRVELVLSDGVRSTVVR